MPSTAILIGNATYLSGNNLPCCRDDVLAMRELLEATKRFDNIIDCIDLDADGMRDAVRNALPSEEKQSEVFFFFPATVLKSMASSITAAQDLNLGAPTRLAFLTQSYTACSELPLRRHWW